MKNHIRDYATAAFHFYAKEGGSEKYKQKIYDEAMLTQNGGKGSGISNPTEAMITRAEKAVEDKIAIWKDLEAVEDTLTELRIDFKFEAIKAIEYVYFVDTDKDIQKGDIQGRVHTASLMIPASERQIYKWLRDAREIFAENRGLRV